MGDPSETRNGPRHRLRPGQKRQQLRTCGAVGAGGALNGPLRSDLMESRRRSRKSKGSGAHFTSLWHCSIKWESHRLHPLWNKGSLPPMAARSGQDARQIGES